jgi:osmoprotectant transport system permease protein
MKRNLVWRWWWLLLATGIFILLISQSGWWQATLSAIFPNQAQVLYPTASLSMLVIRHLELVLISSALTLAVSIPLGIWVTRPSGRDFLGLSSAVSSLGQTFPPVAVLALAVPVLGFGLWPAVIALFLYGMLPVVRNTIAGIQAVSPGVLDAAAGVGMSPIQTLWRVELPLAAPVIMAGVRTSVIINVGTAMVGAVVGSGGLGVPIVSGLVQSNTAFVLEGALPAAGMALLLDQLLANIENSLAPPAA